MRHKFRKFMCYVLIIILLPYVVTVFMNKSAEVSNTGNESLFVNVRSGEQVLSMSLEDYGIGILAREIPITYQHETLKAQAVLIRTRIYRLLEENGTDYIFEESFWSQMEMEEVWGITGYAIQYKKLENAWEETKGQVLFYENQLAYTPFFRLSNGSTRDGSEVLEKEYPYLKIKECPLDIESAEQMQTLIIDKADIEIVSRDTAGYVLEVQIGEETINGEEFRKNYGLASSCFSIQEYDGKLRITTRGVGHGIGMSQYMADRMAENGNDYRDILEYFFEECSINIVADIIQKEV